MDVQNSPSHHLVGTSFSGLKANRSWNVKEKITRPKGGTGGTFSVGYVAADDTGEEFFLKATDIGLLRIEGVKSKAQFPKCMHGLLIAAARQARGDALPTMPMRWNHRR